MNLPLKLGLIYLVSEVALQYFRRASGRSRRADGGSFYALWITIGLGITGGIALTHFAPAFHFSLLPAVRQFLGILFAGGLILRWWAIFSLGKFFTVDVAIAQDGTGPLAIEQIEELGSARLKAPTCVWFSCFTHTSQPARALSSGHVNCGVGGTPAARTSAVAASSSASEGSGSIPGAHAAASETSNAEPSVPVGKARYRHSLSTSKRQAATSRRW